MNLRRRVIRPPLYVIHGSTETQTHCPRDERHAVNPSEAKPPSQPHSVGIDMEQRDGEYYEPMKRNREVHPSVVCVVDENIQHSPCSITITVGGNLCRVSVQVVCFSQIDLHAFLAH